MSLINVGLTGLRSTQTSLATTSHNISNANTEGFSRQRTEQITQLPSFSGAGFIGNGSRIVAIERFANEFLNEELRLAGEALSASESFLNQAQQLDSLLASSNTSLTGSLERFFASLSTAAEDPQSAATRQLVLSEASGLADRFNILHQEIFDQNQFVNSQVAAAVQQINQLAENIASVNAAVAASFSNGREPNDLLDSRDVAIRELSQLVGITGVEQNDGTINIFIGTGQPLVVGEEVTQLSTALSLDSGFTLDIIQPESGTIVTSVISGGQLGGVLGVQGDVLLPALNEIGRLAVVTANSINLQQAQGLDLEGNFGLNIFADINTTPAMEDRVSASLENVGTAQLQVAIDDTSLLTTSDYLIRVVGTTYEISRLDDNTVLTTGALPIPASIDLVSEGFDIQLIGGTAVDGDRFLISPTRRAAQGIELVLNEPSQLAFSDPVRSSNVSSNRGDITVSTPNVISALDVNNQSLLATTGGALPFELVYSEATNQFQVANLPAGFTATPANFAYTSGVENTLTINLSDALGNNLDLEIQISGRPENSDTVLIEFNTDGVSDNRNALEMVAVQTTDLIRSSSAVANANQSLVDTYGQLVERVGVVTSQKTIETEANQSIFDQAFVNREEISGVNLDEEAANLIRFEQAYNASAQVIAIARDLFDRILQI